MRDLRLGIGLSRKSGGAFSPSSLFVGGVAGAWYDPSDLSSMFQDAAGTVPAVVDGPVGRINDKSGNGNHMTQATAANRPTLRQSGALHYLEGDGSNDCLQSGVFGTAMNDFMVMAAVRNTNGFGTSFVAEDSGASSASVGWTSGAIVATDSASSSTDSMSAPAGATDYVMGAVVAVASPASGTFHVNAATEALALTGACNNINSFGLFAVPFYNPTSGRFYGGLLVGRIPSGSEVASSKTFLGAKAGLVL